MERRERYDPEDIENLLTERGFDELLEEERAFVLRHMSGREEYDRMRALLHYTRPDERSHTMIEPEERVRTNVMNAFRAQREPTWRVWLNSVMAWFAPSETADLWRPALALGTLALLVIAGVFTVQYVGGPEHGGLAEAREAERSTSKSTPTQVEVQAEDASGTTSIADMEPAPRSEEVAEPRETHDLMTDPQGASTEKEPLYKALDEVPDVPVRELSESEEITYGTNELEMDLALEDDMKKESRIPTGHVVTQEELMTNQSLANTDVSAAKKSSGKARSKASSVADGSNITSRPLGEDPRLLGLVTAGW
ncbi:MAG: hypothetical protein KDC00_07450 [Flavobacteriales bacterium]|nr:hypothetical protein [Flavobacteriales bacterium]